jgi:predicted glycoside hydrolase/deacetylase ChbG (UPF0249 family)
MGLNKNPAMNTFPMKSYDNPIQLIINADDYGRTRGVSAGIRFAHLEGVVTSTTAMMNISGVEEALLQAQSDCPNLGLGVHLVLTAGKPILPVNQVFSLTGGKNHFPSSSEFLEFLRGIDPDQVRTEWNAQIQKFILVTGRKPDHLDSHHHTSYFSPSLFQVMLELAGEYECAIRPPLAEEDTSLPLDLPDELGQQAMDFLPPILEQLKPLRPDFFYSSFYDQAASLENLMAILARLRTGTTEIMCHPGYADQELVSGSRYNIQRENELAILTDPAIRSFIQDAGINLINYSQLKSRSRYQTG